jgi:hypothetical protein
MSASVSSIPLFDKLLSNSESVRFSDSRIFSYTKFRNGYFKVPPVQKLSQYKKEFLSNYTSNSLATPSYIGMVKDYP